MRKRGSAAPKRKRKRAKSLSDDTDGDSDEGGPRERPNDAAGPAGSSGVARVRREPAKDISVVIAEDSSDPTSMHEGARDDGLLRPAEVAHMVIPTCKEDVCPKHPHFAEYVTKLPRLSLDRVFDKDPPVEAGKYLINIEGCEAIPLFVVQTSAPETRLKAIFEQFEETEQMKEDVEESEHGRLSPLLEDDPILPVGVEILWFQDCAGGFDARRILMHFARASRYCSRRGIALTDPPNKLDVKTALASVFEKGAEP